MPESLQPPDDLQPEVMPVDEVDEAWRVLEASFGAPAHEADRAAEVDVVDPSRFLVVRDRGRLVATSGTFALDLTLPGGPAPVAGVTWVGVEATYRRRGLLGAMMRRLLADLHEAGEAVAALWASEGAIYQRYGYGPASWHLSLETRSGAALVRDVPRGGLRLEEPSAALLAAVHDRVAAATPGWWRRDDAWWRHRLHDPAHARDGAAPLRAVLTDDGDGYALYATAPRFGPAGADGRLRVRELAAATPEAAARLWRFLLDLDLVRTVEGRLALDDPLLHLAAEPRALQGRLDAALWVRPVEVAGALSARAYATEVDVVLDVQDGTCPWNTGRWRLSGGPAGAVCAPSTDPADLALDVADLGAALLGGTPLLARAAAGRVVEHRPGALRAASTAFGPLDRVPYCPMVF